MPNAQTPKFKPSPRPAQRDRLAGACESVFEQLERRQLMSATTVQTLPFNLDFSQPVGTSADVLDKNGQATGFTRIQQNKLNDQYQPSLIALDTTAGVLKLTTRGSSTSGGNAGADNTLVNALETQFDGTQDGFQITARLKGPLNFDQSFEQQGIYLGADQDDFIKLVAIKTNEGQRLQFFDEYSTGTGGTYSSLAEPDSRLNIGGFGGINSLDLRITGVASTGKLSASYAVNGGQFADLPFQISVPQSARASVFNAASRAGLIQFQKNNVAPITVSYDSFSITRSTDPITYHPAVVDSTPAQGATNVRRDLNGGITTNLYLPTSGAGVDESTLGPATVLLTRVSDGLVVSGTNATTSGGGDTITLTLAPGTSLAANTQYRFDVTDGVRDLAGASFTPYAATFTTGADGKIYDPSVSFDKIVQTTTEGKQFTGLTVGPDHRLYATTITGEINRFDIAADGSLTNGLLIKTIQTNNGGNRIVTGLTFDPASTATNLIAYVSHGEYAFGENGSPKAGDFTGKITKLTGPTLGTYEDKVIGLPRSIRDHLTNQPVFGPDGLLYVSQAAENAMGAADNAWGNRPEHLLSAAILQVDVRGIVGTLNVKTPDGGGTYDPFAAGAKVKLYATGVRNSYDLVWHSNGHLYAPVNGSASGGATPEADVYTPGDVVNSRTNDQFDNYSNADSDPANDYAKVRIDAAANGAYTGPRGPGIVSNPVKEHDWLFDVQPTGYYGHPNPLRDEWILNGGNPTGGTDPQEVAAYPVGTLPDRNYRGIAYDFGESKSPDGAIEYKGNAFNGALNGKLLVTRFNVNNDLLVMSLDAQGNVTGVKDNYVGLDGFVNPLDVTQDPQTGFLYVSEYDRSGTGIKHITLLRPSASGATVNVSKPAFYFNDVSDGANSGTADQTLTIRNTGTSALVINGLTLGGANADQFKIRNAPSLPASIPAGASMDVLLDFTASSKGIKSATLTLSTNDMVNPTTTVTLRGIGTTGTGGTNEPSLQRILDLYQIPINTGNTNPDNTLTGRGVIAGSDELGFGSLVKAGSGAVTIEPLATFGVDFKPTVVNFGYYEPGTPALKTELFKVGKQTAQSVTPQIDGKTSFDPADKAFSLYGTFPYFKSADGGVRNVYSEDSLNTWESNSAYRRKVKFFPLKNADGSVVPNAYVFAFEEYNQEADQNDLVGIIRNVRPAAAGGEIGLSNTDQETPFPDRLVMSRLRELDASVDSDPNAYANYVHDSASVTVRNTGTQTLNVGAPSVSNGDFIITSGGGARSVAPGQSYTLTVQFVYNRTGSGHENRYATLTIPSDDADEPTKSVALAGIWQSNSEYTLPNKQSVEPQVQDIFDAFGYSTQAGQLDTNGAAVKAGGETISPYWMQADASGPVQIIQIASYHGQAQGKKTVTRWYEQGTTPSSSSPKIFTQNDRYGQSLLPRIDGSTTAPSFGRFDPQGKAFGLRVDGQASDDQFNNSYNPNGTGTPGQHGIRFYAARDSAGNLIPNTYLVVHDYTGTQFTNFDYQDNVYVVTNVKPVNPPGQVAGLSAAATGAGIKLSWSANTEANVVGYNVYRRVGTSGAFALVNPDAPVIQTTFTDAAAPADGSRSYYRVVAVDEHGQESAAATADAVRGADTTPPAKPIGLTSTGTPDGVFLDFDDNAEPDLAGYNVYRSTSATGTFAKLNGGTLRATSDFTDTAAAAGTAYFYRVTAVDQTGNESAVSSTVTGTRGQPPAATAPAAATNAVATAASATRVDLAWADNSNNETAFSIQRRTGSGAFVTITTVAPNVTTYADTTVAASTSYAYRVIALNNVGSAAPSNEAAATTPAAGTPTGPAAFLPDSTGLVTFEAEHYDAKVDQGGRSWTSYAGPVAGASGTALEAGPNGGLKVDANIIGNAPRLDFKVNFSTPGTYYVWFRGEAPDYASDSVHVGIDGAEPTTANNTSRNGLNEFGWSNYRSGGAPTITVATAGVHTVNVWMREDGVVFDKLLLTPSASYTPTGNGPAESARSNPAPTPTAPAAPSNLAATLNAQNQVALAWSDNSADETGFRVERRAAGGTFAALASVAANATTYTDATAAAGTTYEYRVFAVNGAGDSAASNTATQATPAAPAAPAAPSNLAASLNGQNQVVLAWADNSANETAFRLERRVAGGTFATLADLPANTTGYTDASVAPGTTYEYRVRALNGVGASDSSNTVSQATPAAPAGAAGFQESGGLVTFEAEHYDAKVDQGGRSWTPYAGPVAGASGTALEAGPNGGLKVDADIIGNAPRLDFKVNFSTPGTYYVWFRGEAPDYASDSVHVGIDGAEPTTANNTSRNGLNEFGWSNYRSGGAPTITVATAGVHTVNVWMREDGVVFDKLLLTTSATYAPTGNGPAESPRTNPTPPPAATAPAAPSNLAASAASQTRVDLTWADHSTDETGFVIERATGNGAFAVLTTVGANVTTFADTTVAASTSYQYRVKAVKTGSGTTLESAYTNTAGATTPANTVTPPAGPAAFQPDATGLVTFEAENYDAKAAANGQDWTPFNGLPGASGVGGLEAGPNTGVKYDTNYVGNSPRLDYKVNFAQPGTYYVWVRGSGPTGADDSIHVGLNGSAIDTADRISFPKDAQWQWTAATSDGPVATLTITQTGVQTVNVWMREDGVRIDKILLTRSASYTPTGTGPAESARTGTTPAPTAPAAPSNLTVANGTANSAPVVSLAWTDNSADETGFRVDRRVAGTSAWGTLASVATNATGYADSTAAASTSYEYRVVAVNNVGPSPASNTAAVTTPNANTPPAANPATPTNLTASASGTSVNLAWTDNATDEDLYQVFRRDGTDGQYALLGTRPANATTYLDDTTAAGGSYGYQVRAVRNDGALSDFSNEVQILLASGSTLSSTDVGNPAAGSTTVVTPGKDYDIAGAGYDVWNARDEFRFASRSVTGNFDVKVRVESLTGGFDNWAAAGLMARDGLAENARNVFIKASRGNGERLSYRAATGGGSTALGNGTPQYPNAWLRLTRVGNLFVGYDSTDGVTWREVGRVTLSLPATLQVGLAANSHQTGTLTTAKFRDLSFA